MRISPAELHIDDVEFYDKLYVAGSTRRTVKYGWAMKMFGRSTTTFATESHELQRIYDLALTMVDVTLLTYFGLGAIKFLE